MNWVPGRWVISCRGGRVWGGWSINLSMPPDADFDCWVEFPVKPLFVGEGGAVMELVFWSDCAKRWVHAVSDHFWRELPKGHIQVTTGDLAWLRGVMARHGWPAIRDCVAELERGPIPAVEEN